jgi:hypothetical protein
MLSNPSATWPCNAGVVQTGLGAYQGGRETGESVREAGKKGSQAPFVRPIRKRHLD